MAKNITITLTPGEVDAYWHMSASYAAQHESEEDDWTAELRRIFKAQQHLDQKIRERMK